MGLFEKKSDEERASDSARKTAEKEEREKERANQQWLVTPIGMATTAKEQGNRFLEIELEIGSSTRKTSGDVDSGVYKRQDFASLLGQIENLGWKLEHVGYYFMITSESTKDRLAGLGESTAVSGNTMGVYLFRNIEG